MNKTLENLTNGIPRNSVALVVWQSLPTLQKEAMILVASKNTIIVVAWLDRGARNDPVAMGLALHHDDPTFCNALAGTCEYISLFYTSYQLACITQT